MIDMPFMNMNYGPGELGGLVFSGGVQGAQAEFYKALSAGAVVDPSSLTGGGALRRESLEASLLRTQQQLKHMVFWNRCPKTRATATVDQWTRKDDIGGVPGSSVNSEAGAANESTGTYLREVGLVKYIMDKRRVTGIAEIQSQHGLVSAIAEETDSGSLKVLTDFEWLSMNGDATADANEFSGFPALMRDLAPADHVIDMRGAPVSADAREFITAAQIATSMGSWGEVTDYFCSPAIQQDLTLTLQPAYRLVLSDRRTEAVYGAPVRGIHTDFGDMGANIERFILEYLPPYVTRAGNYALLQATGINPPQAVAGTPGANAASLFDATTAGKYYYAVESAKTGSGRSALVKSAQVTIAAGEQVSIAITDAASVNYTHYVVYRSRQDGTNADADFREMVRVAVGGTGTTTVIDRNGDIPGCSFAAVMTLREDAISVRRFGDQMRFPLFPTDSFMHLWLQMLFGYIRLGKPRQHVLIKNLLPTSATWRPHG